MMIVIPQAIRNEAFGTNTLLMKKPQSSAREFNFSFTEKVREFKYITQGQQSMIQGVPAIDKFRSPDS